MKKKLFIAMLTVFGVSGGCLDRLLNIIPVEPEPSCFSLSLGDDIIEFCGDDL